MPAAVSYPPPSGEVCTLHPVEPSLLGSQAAPRQPEAEALWTDQSWRPCMVLSWARAPAGWVVHIRWPDGTSGWYEHDPANLRAAAPASRLPRLLAGYLVSGTSRSLRASSSTLTSLKVTTLTFFTNLAGRYMSQTHASCMLTSK
jgi:hypothetical protein